MRLEHAIERGRLIAILRGLRVEEAIDIAGVLVEAGISMIEVPLNSPDPFVSIERIATKFGDQALIGAGTVLAKEDCDRIKSAGGKLVVSPNCNPVVIAHAKQMGMSVFPGVCTTTEAFKALDAGADGLKLFPFQALGPSILKAWKAVLPIDTHLFPVGGVKVEDMASLVTAGATGFGIGSELYKAGMPSAEVKRRAEIFAITGHRAALPE